MAVVFEVKEYEVFVAREMTVDALGARFSAYIVCKGESEHRLCLYFSHGGPLVANTVENGRIGRAFLPAEAYPWVVDLLRNERPVYAYLNPDEPLWNRLYTGPEPVGEGEGAPGSNRRGPVPRPAPAQVA